MKLLNAVLLAAKIQSHPHHDDMLQDVHTVSLNRADTGILPKSLFDGATRAEFEKWLLQHKNEQSTQAPVTNGFRTETSESNPTRNPLDRNNQTTKAEKEQKKDRKQKRKAKKRRKAKLKQLKSIQRDLENSSSGSKLNIRNSSSKYSSRLVLSQPENLARAGHYNDINNTDLPKLHTKNSNITILSSTYVPTPEQMDVLGEQTNGKLARKLRKKKHCATIDERTELNEPKCRPGQYWAANKNPKCALTFADAVYEQTKTACEEKVSDYACVCPCSRPYILTYQIEFELSGQYGSQQLNAECQICRSEKQIVARGLIFNTAEEVKCDRSVRRVAKRWIEHEDDHDEDEDH